MNKGKSQSQHYKQDPEITSNTSQLAVDTDTPDKSNSSRELLEHRLIPNTPFLAVRMDDKWFLALGNHRLTDPIFNSYEDVETNSKDTSWDRLLTIMNIMIEANRKYHEENTLKKQ